MKYPETGLYKIYKGNGSVWYLNLQIYKNNGTLAAIEESHIKLRWKQKKYFQFLFKATSEMC